MCDPMTLAVAGATVGATSDVLGFVGQNRASAANKQASHRNYFDRMSAIQQQTNELDAFDAESSVDEAIVRAQEGGRISTTASEFVSSASQARLRGAALQESSRSEAVADLNSRNSRAQIGRDKRGAAIEREAQIAKVAPGDPVALALKLTGRGISAAGDYKSMTKGS